MIRSLVWLTAAVGCTKDTSPSTTDGTTPTDGPTTETGTTPVTTPTGDTGTPPPPALDATCDPTANPQVFKCTITLASAGPATIVFTAAGAPTRTFTASDAATVHVLDGWGLLPDTTYDWDAGGVSGTVTTGSLPSALAGADFRVTGTMFGIDAALIYVKCGYFVMVDSDGRVLWYLQTDLYDTFSDGMRWSQATKTMIAVTDSTMSFDTSEVGESDLEWNPVLHLTTADFDLKLTHDVDRWGDYRYLLGETNGRIGGFEVFDGTTKLGQWLLTDGFPTTNGLDSAHVNGLSVEDGEVIVSSLGFSAGIAVDGDPASATFLQMLWHASGSPGGGGDLPSPDYVPASGSALFQSQHNVSLHGDELWVFDNGSQANARAVRIQLDATNGTMTQLDAWSTGEHCANQGGSQPVDGGALVTCANSDHVSEFRDGASIPDWTLYATCGSIPTGGASTRAYGVIVE